MTHRRKFRRNLPQRPRSAGLGVLPGQSAGLRNHFGRDRLTTFAAALLRPDAIAGVPQFSDYRCFFELRYRSENLPHHFCRWRRIGKVGWRIHRHQFNTATLQEGMACKLHRQITCEPACIFDQNNPHVVHSAMREKCNKALPSINRIGTGDGCIIELSIYIKFGNLGISRHGLPLPPFAVLVRTNICSGTGAVISDCGGLSHSNIPRVSAGFGRNSVNYLNIIYGTGALMSIHLRSRKVLTATDPRRHHFADDK